LPTSRLASDEVKVKSARSIIVLHSSDIHHMVKMVLIYPIHYEDLIFEVTEKEMKLHRDRITSLRLNRNTCMGHLATVRGPT